MNSAFDIDESGCKLIVTLGRKELAKIIKGSEAKSDASVNAFGFCLVIAVSNMFESIAKKLKDEDDQSQLDLLRDQLSKHLIDNIKIALDEAAKNYKGDEDE